MLEKNLVFLKEKVLKVFKVFRYKIKDKKIYKIYDFKILYQDSCPKFYISCPLSKKKSSLIKEIFDGREIPLVCERYANKKFRKKSSYSF